MANVYWHADGGNWSDHATHWFNATDGGGGGHGAAPGIDDNAIFDANSFDNAAQTVTVDAAANCLDMDWTGATNTPTLSIPVAVEANRLSIYGNVTFINAMIVTGRSYIALQFAGTTTLTTNGVTIACGLYLTGTSLTLVDALVATGKDFGIDKGTLNTNGQTLTCRTFSTALALAIVLTFGTSTINCTAFSNLGTNMTVTANTSTINVSGTGVFAGGGITTYNIVNLNGTARTISGSNTFAKLLLLSTQTQTITFTDGTTQTITNPVLSGSAGKVHTLTGSSTAGWAMTSSQNPVQVHYCTIDYSTVSGSVWYALLHDNNIDGGSNSGWTFTTVGGTAQSIRRFVPLHLKRDFYHGVGGHSGTRHNGLDPYGWTTNGLVLYLPLWALKDSAFKSVDAYKTTATVSGATCIWLPNGRNFTTATPDYIEILAAASTRLDFTSGDFSLVARVKIDVYEQHHNVFVRGLFDADGYEFRISVNGQLYFRTNQAAANQVSSSAAGDIVAATWYTIGVSRSGTSVKLYRNGVDRTTTSGTHINPLTSPKNLRIGANDTGALPLDGIIQDVFAYNRALSAGEHLDIHKRLSWRV